MGAKSVRSTIRTSIVLGSVLCQAGERFVDPFRIIIIIIIKMFRSIVVLTLAAAAVSTTDAAKIERSREAERDLRWTNSAGKGSKGSKGKSTDPCVAECQAQFEVCVDTCAAPDCIPLDTTATPTKMPSTKGSKKSKSSGKNKFGKGKGSSSEAPVSLLAFCVWWILVESSSHTHTLFCLFFLALVVLL